jgi:hypothetical protein
MKDEVAVLSATGGEVKVLDSGCCGVVHAAEVLAGRI